MLLNPLWYFSARIYTPIFHLTQHTPISKRHLRPGRMAPSEWTRSVRAVRDTPVADYSAPSINTTRRVAYHPPIAVLPYLLALSVSYFKQTVWRCGQLWPYVGMGSLGTRLHWDCNAMGDAARISTRVPSTSSSRSVGRTWEDMILPGCEDPRNGVDPRTDQVRPKVGKDRVCILVVWQDEMEMRCCLSTTGSPEYILCVAHSTSVTPVSPYTYHRSFHLCYPCISVHSPSLIPPPSRLYHHTPTVAHSTSVTPRSPYTHSRSLTTYFESVIDWVWRCTGRLWSSEFGDALGGRDGVNSEMHLEAVIERVWRCTGRPRWSELGDALGGRDRASLEIHWEAEMEWTQRCTWRPWWIGFGDALGGCDRASLEMHSVLTHEYGMER